MDHIFFSTAARPLYLWNLSWNVLISDAEQKDTDASLALTLKEIGFNHILMFHQDEMEWLK